MPAEWVPVSSLRKGDRLAGGGLVLTEPEPSPFGHAVTVEYGRTRRRVYGRVRREAS